MVQPNEVYHKGRKGYTKFTKGTRRVLKILVNFVKSLVNFVVKNTTIAATEFYFPCNFVISVSKLKVMEA